MSKPDEQQFVSRAGSKLEAALVEFCLDPQGFRCADLGSHVGGFVDCLLSRGASKVYSIDTSYGTLAWKLRKNPRVEVLERTNALFVKLPEKVDLVTIDVGWTRQRLIIPRALELLITGGSIITLIKPHYEASKDQLDGGVLRPECFDTVVSRVLVEVEDSGVRLVKQMESPLRGHGGNREVLALLR